MPYIEETKSRTKLKLILIFSLASALILGGLTLLSDFGIYHNPLRGKVYGKVGNHFVDQWEVSQTKKDTAISTNKMAVVLMDKWLYKQMGKKLGITFSRSDVESELKSRTGTDKPHGKKYLLAAIEKDLLMRQIEIRVPGYIEGKMVVVNFDQHLPYGGVYDLQVGETEAKRSDYIKQDRQNADTVVKDIASKLKSKQVNFDQAMKLEKDDPNLGEGALATTPHSGLFNTSDQNNPLYGISNTNEVLSVIRKLEIGQISEPFIVKVPTSASETSPALMDARWVIAKVEKRLDKLAGDLTEYEKQEKTRLKYTVNQ